MAKKTKQTTPDKRAAKKAAVLGTEKKGAFPFNILYVVGAVCVFAIFYFLSGGQKEELPAATPVVVEASSEQVDSKVNPKGKAKESSLDTPAKYVPTGGRVTYPVDQFDDSEARYYEYTTDDGLNIRYFVLKSSDGVIRAAFDACDVCWRAGRGYQQSGDNMVCRNCGRQFPSVSVNVIQGGCNPSPLDRRIEGDKVVIEVNDILKGRQYFNFGGGR